MVIVQATIMMPSESGHVLENCHGRKEIMISDASDFYYVGVMHDGNPTFGMEQLW